MFFQVTNVYKHFMVVSHTMGSHYSNYFYSWNHTVTHYFNCS